MAASRKFLLDPTRNTASVLRRIGVLALMAGLPLAAAAARIGPVLAFVIGVALIVAASLLDDAPGRLRQAIVRLLGSTAVLATAVGVGWGALSLVWTPAPDWRNALGLAAILGLGLAGYLTLPDKMRAANLYPITIGTGALVLVAIALIAGIWKVEPVERMRQLDRALAVLVLFAWPSIAWLRSRGRDLEALAVALGASAAAAFGPSPVPVLAFALGAFGYLVAQLSPRGATLLGLLLACLFIGAPAILGWHGLDTMLPADWAPGLSAWRDALLTEPARLLTGHGLGALRLRPDLPAGIGVPLLGLWYELGVVGALSVAVALVAILHGAEQSFGPLLPGLAAAVVTSLALGFAGIGGGALWWPVALVTTALLFIATRRGQFRTRRPRAIAGIGRARTGDR